MLRKFLCWIGMHYGPVETITRGFQGDSNHPLYVEYMRCKHCNKVYWKEI